MDSLEIDDGFVSEEGESYGIRSYKDLRVWQESMSLAEDIYRHAANLPGAERYCLQSQMQRAAVSVPCNIAEGNARNSTRDYLRFLSIARGSLAELETQVMLSERLQFMDGESCSKLRNRMETIRRQLCNLESALERRLQGK